MFWAVRVMTVRFPDPLGAAPLGAADPLGAAPLGAALPGAADATPEPLGTGAAVGAGA
jgi:hypothetical protein